MSYSVLKTMELWSQSLGTASKALNATKNLRIALKLYSFEGLGYKTRGMKTNEFEQFCADFSLQKWVRGLPEVSEYNSSEEAIGEFGQLELFTIATPETQFVDSVLRFFDEQFDAAVANEITSAQTKRNYRSALGQYLKWMVSQVWWLELFPEYVPEVMPKATGRSLKPPQYWKQAMNYKLKEGQLSTVQQEELNAFKEFRVTGGKRALKQRMRAAREGKERQVRPRLSPVKESNFEEHDKHFIFLFWGWCVNVNGDPIDTLSLDLLTDSNRLQDYVDWLVEDRQRTHALAVRISGIGIAVAKWRNFHKTERRNWSDINLIEDLRELQSFFKDNYREEQQATLREKWALKELSHEQARQAVQYLRKLCAPYRTGSIQQNRKNPSKTRRSDAAVVRAWQTYLLVKIFVYLPVRQQEIRQLKFGKTLFREIDEQGKPFYSALITDHKLKSKTQRDRRYKLPDILTQDLDVWIQVWREKASQALTSLDQWLHFWGYCPDHLDKLQRQLESAKQGNVPPKVKNLQSYIQNIEGRIRNLQTRIAAWETAKMNAGCFDPLFFHFGCGSFPERFGQPLTGHSVRATVRAAIAKSTAALFGEGRWTPPHSLRHIAAKHVRLIRGNREGLARLMGHSSEMADAYAEQIMSDYEETQEIVDNWWKAN